MIWESLKTCDAQKHAKTHKEFYIPYLKTVAISKQIQLNTRIELNLFIF
jgi:hypothetical protein